MLSANNKLPLAYSEVLSVDSMALSADNLLLSVDSKGQLADKIELSVDNSMFSDNLLSVIIYFFTISHAPVRL
jgi:hypothetical protein